MPYRKPYRAPQAAIEPVKFGPDEIERALEEILADVHSSEGLKRVVRSST